MTLREKLIGSWTLVSSVDIHPDGRVSETWGASARGTYMFDHNGRFAQILVRSDLPRFANRAAASAEQAKAVVAGSLAMFGTWRVDENASTVIVHFEACTFASFTGTEGRRIATFLSADELKFSNAGRVGGARGESIWRRVT